MQTTEEGAIRRGTYQDVAHFATFPLSRDRPLWVVKIPGCGVVAYAQCYPHSEQGTYLISHLETHVAFRRRGLARQLVKFLQDRDEVGCLIALNVFYDAKPFWKALGFQPQRGGQHYGWEDWW